MRSKKERDWILWDFEGRSEDSGFYLEGNGMRRAPSGGQPRSDSNVNGSLWLSEVGVQAGQQHPREGCCRGQMGDHGGQNQGREEVVEGEYYVYIQGGRCSGREQGRKVEDAEGKGS